MKRTMVPELGDGFFLCKDLHSHQKQGVQWIWGLRKKTGGIIGDEMGVRKALWCVYCAVSL